MLGAALKGPPELVRSKSFMEIDTNGDGLIDIEELMSHLLARGVEPEDISGLFATMAVSSTDYITPEEFKAAHDKYRAVCETASKGDKPNSAQLDENLDEAAKSFDVQLCRELIDKGANPKKVFHKDANGWYEGDSSTCLYNAIKQFQKGKNSQEEYVDVVALLLEKGADPNFSAVCGNWSRCTSYPLIEEATKTIHHLGTSELKVKFLRAFIDAGVEVNKAIRRGKQKSSYGYGVIDYPIFGMVEAFKDGGGDLGLIELYLDCGVDVNCAKSSWSVQFDSDDDDDESGKDLMTLLHAAIDTGHVDLVKLLVARGADVNTNMVFTHKSKGLGGGGRTYYLMSCLQLAMEKGNGDMVEVLTNAGAQEEVDAEQQCDTNWGHGSGETKNYKEGGEGKWNALNAPKKAKKSDGGKKKCAKKGKKKKK